ncbi:DUF2147 domain-containing protein [Duganella callida]|uniref:DUF2147 domain-containing protein n=1 Tax=Duganella callida TaxID=2561932 RepID=A0A4Y9SBX0_9BURK|nr:DUF2147 domain-containing protein [Duganella callida]TFW19891.1 DUF2147 domain-containing protein [Duganella callida]
MKKLMMAAGLILAAPAWAGTAACANGLCGASGLSAQALSAAAKEDKRPADTLREEPRRQQAPRDGWRRYLPEKDENYNCALSFGVGGNLSKDGFLGSRVLGQTQTWRAPADSGKN